MHECAPVDMSYFESAPVKSQASVVVNAPAEAVFRCFRDATAWTRWAPPITDVEWTSTEPYGVGTTRTVSMIGGSIGEEEFIAWEDGRRMAFRFTRTNLPSEAFAEDYVVTPMPDGGVVVVWTMAMTPIGPGASVAGLTGRSMSFGMRVMLKRFAKLVESDFA